MRPALYGLIIVAGILAVGYSAYRLFNGDSEKPESDGNGRPQVVNGLWAPPSDEVADPFRKQLAGTNVIEKIKALNQLGGMRDAKSMPTILKLMDDPELEVRASAGMAARLILDADFHYRPDAPPEDRAPKIAVIKQYFENFTKQAPAASAKLK